MSKQLSYQKGYQKGYQRGYQQGFDDGVKMGKSLFKPKLPEVNKNYEPEQLNDITTRPGRKKTCLNCDFYKKYLAGGQVYIGDAPCQWCENQPYKISFTPATTVTTATPVIYKGNK